MALTKLRPAGLGFVNGNRNTIINGAMNVAQRGTSSTGLGAAAGYFTCDRWKMDFGSTAGRLTMTQTADGPSGFANCIKLDCTTADTSIAAGEYGVLVQRLEGQDLQKFMKGTSDAKSYTVSFYVKGNASATYILELIDRDNSRSVSKTFSVTTSWSRVELTFPADTTGAFNDDNAVSLDLQWWFHSGSTYNSGTLQQTWAGTTAANRAAGGDSFFDSTNRTFFMTGVQLEVGDVATPFEHEDFGTTLRKCQRYTYIMSSSTSSATTEFINGAAYSASQVNAGMDLPVTMRATPTVTYGNATGAYRFYRAGGNDPFDTLESDNPTNLHLQFAGTAGLSHTSGVAGSVQLRYGDGAFVKADAEL